jgi:hypothetical protein
LLDFNHEPKENTGYMRKLSLLIAGIGVLGLLGLATPSMAADTGKELSITGDAKCAKCALKETDKCQTVIQTEAEGKKVTYYLADNKVAKDFHMKVCKETKKVKATGTVKEVGGKEQLTLTKIEVVE